MSVYTSAAVSASGCASPGCACRGRIPAYPSDLADAEWSVLEPEARGVMAELVAVSGRPMVHDLRAVLGAIGYVTRYGIEWRALPVGFPPHEAVYAFFVRWSRRGLPERLAGRLRGRLRVLAGRAELPTAGCIDSQTVRAAETVGAAACGYDAGKKLKGQKRHVVVDTLGLSPGTPGEEVNWPPSSGSRTSTASASSCPNGPTRATSTRSDLLSTGPCPPTLKPLSPGSK